MRSDLFALIGTQLSAPLARIAFALVLVPVHPDGESLVLVLALAELLSTFLTFGRNYLLSSGFNHALISPWLDKVVLSFVTVFVYYALSTAQQRVLWSGVVVMTAAITTMTMTNAWLLKERRLAFVLPLNVLVYTLAAFATSYSAVHALLALVGWLLAEKAIPSERDVSSKRIFPVLATLLAFASQRIDVQASALIGDPKFLREVFQLNTLFLPLALLVRLVGNTALLRGEALMDGSRRALLAVAVLGVGYSLALYMAGAALHNATIVDNFWILALTALLSASTIAYRESIAIRSRRGDFLPLFWFSVVGVLPGLSYMAFAIRHSTGATVFLLATYLAPRLLMLLYGTVFLRTPH